jgi:hypothetical protein
MRASSLRKDLNAKAEIQNVWSICIRGDELWQNKSHTLT